MAPTAPESGGRPVGRDPDENEGPALAPWLSPGRELSGLQLGRVLGRGGMGSVHEATVMVPSFGLAVGTKVALKVLHPGLLAQPEFAQRFEREATLGLAVRHPNVVRTYGRLTATLPEGARVDGIVLEHVAGRSLEDVLRERGPLPEASCRRLARELGSALAALHAAQAIHRDVKPENVLVLPGGDAKLIDLGLAHLINDVLRLSTTGMFVGTTFYAAPEQFLGDSSLVDERADLYALGLVLYEAATGRHPFAASSPEHHIRRMVRDIAPPARQLRPDLSAFFEEVLRTSLERERDLRFASAKQLVDVLEGAESSAWWRERERAVTARFRRSGRVRGATRETAIYGRDAQLKELEACFDAARGGRGNVVLVEGEVGIGKTTLMDELVFHLRQRGEEVAILQGGYSPDSASTAEALIAAFARHYEAVGMDAHLPEHLREAPALAPAFASLLRDRGLQPGQQPLSSDQLHTVFSCALQGLAAEAPVALIVEDLHFATEAGRLLFRALAHAIDGQPVLLIATVRPESLTPKWIAELGRLAPTRRMRLERLTGDDVRALLSESFGSPSLVSDLEQEIRTLTGGIPLFVAAAVRELRESGQVVRGGDGRWTRAQAGARLRIPTTISDWVDARLAALEPADVDLLRVAACYGHEFDPEIVGAAAGRSDPIEVLDRFSRLRDSSRLVRIADDDEDAFVFDFPLIQQTLYEKQPRQLRQRRHAALAAKLIEKAGSVKTATGAQAVRICEHLLRGTAPADALPWLRPALDHLERGLVAEHERALGLAELALTPPGLLEGSARFEVLLRRASQMDLLGRPAEERRSLEEALVLADEPAEGAPPEALPPTPARGASPSVVGAAGAPPQVFISHSSQDLQRAEQVRRVLDASGMRCWIAPDAIPAGAEWVEALVQGIRSSKAMVLVFSEHANRSEHVRREIMEAAEAGVWIVQLCVERVDPSPVVQFYLRGKHRLEAWTPPLGAHLAHLAEQLHRRLVLGEVDLATPAANPVATPGVSPERLAMRIRARLQLVWHFLRTGQHRLAGEMLPEVIRLAKAAGDPSNEARAIGFLGMACQGLGRLAEAQQHLELALARFRELKDPRYELSALGQLGNLMQALGRFEEAYRYHAEPARTFKAQGNVRFEAVAEGNLGTSALSMGLLEKAGTHFRRHLELTKRIGYRLGEATALLNLGRYHSMLGDATTAGECLDRARTLFSVLNPAEEARCLLALAEVAVHAGDVAGAEHRYRQAMAALGGAPTGPAVGLLAMTCVGLGAQLMANERVPEALALLDRAQLLGKEGFPEAAVLAAAHVTGGPDRDPTGVLALEALAQFESRLAAVDRMEAVYTIGERLKEPSLILRAQGMLARLVESAPAPFRGRMVADVRLFARIAGQATSPPLA